MLFSISAFLRYTQNPEPQPVVSVFFSIFACKQQVEHPEQAALREDTNEQVRLREEEVNLIQGGGDLMSYSVKFFEGCYIGDYIGECYGGH